MLEIIDKKECCGCGACRDVCPSLCISMQCDEEGFSYPYVEKKLCIGCGKCERVCPLLNIRDEKYMFEEEGYAAININTDERLGSSSGGVFPLLASEVYKSGGVVVGASMAKDCMSVEHIIVKEHHHLKKLYGSKYVQSNMVGIFEKIKKELDENVTVLFSGVPCQIAGLKNYLSKTYDNLICVDVICHGVPSPGLWKQYAEFLESKYKSKLMSVNFRSKEKEFFSLCYKNNIKSYYISKEADPFMQMFLKDLCLRPSCYACKYKGEQRNSDITLGDFWGIDEYAEELNDGYGASIVIAHSLKGKKLLERITPNLKTKLVNLEDVFMCHNESMTMSAAVPENRKRFFEDYNNLTFTELSHKYVSISSKQKLKEIFRKIGVLQFIRRVKNPRGVYTNNCFGMHCNFKKKLN